MVILNTLGNNRENMVAATSRMLTIEYGTADIDEVCREYARVIDNAEFISIEGGIVKTPFGETHYSNLSSGAKVAMYVHLCIKYNKLSKRIFIGGAGENATELIFKEANDTGLVLVTNHPCVPDMDGYTFKINDTIYRIDKKTGNTLDMALFKEFEKDNRKKGGIREK